MPILRISAQNLSESKHKLIRYASKPSRDLPCYLRPLVGGPFDGLKMPIEQIARVGHISGWCFDSEDGLGAASYELQPDGTMKFMHVYWPGRNDHMTEWEVV